MWMPQRFLAAGAILGSAVCALATVPAGAIVGPAGGQRIAIKRCEPSQSVTTTPIGFAPGFYPGGRYFWDDPFGYPYYQRPLAVNQSGSLSIDYVNVTPVVMRTIEFGLVANGKLVAEVRDVGTFSPGIEIKHQFGLDPNVFPLRTALAQCVPLRVTYSDHATWVNPRLQGLRRAILAPP